MNWKKIWQKAKDLYGWDKSQAFYWSDKRAYYKALANSYKKDMDDAKDQKQFVKAKFRYEEYQSAYEKADFIVRSYDDDTTEEGWRNRN